MAWHFNHSPCFLTLLVWCTNQVLHLFKQEAAGILFLGACMHALWTASACLQLVLGVRQQEADEGPQPRSARHPNIRLPSPAPCASSASGVALMPSLCDMHLVQHYGQGAGNVLLICHFLLGLAFSHLIVRQA